MLDTHAPELAADRRERQARSLVVELGEALERRGVVYCCQWKGSWKKHRWMMGEGDIDLLVERATEPQCTAVNWGSVARSTRRSMSPSPIIQRCFFQLPFHWQQYTTPRRSSASPSSTTSDRACRSRRSAASSGACVSSIGRAARGVGARHQGGERQKACPGRRA